MGNLMLAAHSLGLGSIWIHRAKEEFEQPEYQQLLKDLGVEGEWEGIGHCAVGYVNGDIPAPAPRKDGRVDPICEKPVRFFERNPLTDRKKWEIINY